MNCPNCQIETKKAGMHRGGEQRYKCPTCGKRFIQPKEKSLGSMTLSEDKAIACLQLLVEGCSVRSIERITNVHRDTVLRLLETVGKKCLWIQENFVKDVKVGFVQADEIWAYIGMKEKTKINRDIENDKIGTSYTFTAIDAETKLCTAWHLGRRTEADTLAFLAKFRNAVAEDAEYQISTDAYKGYTRNLPMALGQQAHFGQIRKFYGIPNPAEVRYSGGEVLSTIRKKIQGNPIKKHISTSIVERQNLTMRMSMRRMTRLTNGFSKKWENLNYMLALYFAYYNFCRSHKSLNKATPAMAANLANTFWTWKDILAVTPQD